MKSKTIIQSLISLFQPVTDQELMKLLLLHSYHSGHNMFIRKVNNEDHINIYCSSHVDTIITQLIREGVVNVHLSSDNDYVYSIASSITQPANKLKSLLQQGYDHTNTSGTNPFLTRTGRTKKLITKYDLEAKRMQVIINNEKEKVSLLKKIVLGGDHYTSNLNEEWVKSL